MNIEKFEVEIEFTTEALGTAPMDPEIYKRWTGTELNRGEGMARETKRIGIEQHGIVGESCTPKSQ
tara:strand:+ start:906 stop:1103 length:198 start_codon:yes stop_codon:yes gene_type:complete